MGWKTVKINHHQKGFLKTGKLLFPLLGGTWVMLVLGFVLSWKYSIFWKQSVLGFVSTPLKALPYFSSTSWVVDLFTPLNEFLEAAALLPNLNTVSQYLTAFYICPAKQLCCGRSRVQLWAWRALCCCCLLLFRSSFSVALLLHLGCFSMLKPRDTN